MSAVKLDPVDIVKRMVSFGIDTMKKWLLFRQLATAVPGSAAAVMGGEEANIAIELKKEVMIYKVSLLLLRTKAPTIKTSKTWNGSTHTMLQF